ncbi:MAG: pyruvate dehydrogenase (acetyl-transferring) E1 component subunit alpha [bacterium]|nr:pyruvate dehydrogenase (acetyl-transferring) E1 component subunit alpha [bacterium]
MPRKPVAKFVVDHLQILDEKGQVDAKLDPGLPAERLLEMYRWMRLARELDERMLKLQRQGRLGTFPPNTGHEAVSVPIAMAMGPKDWFVGAFRETGGRLVRGEPLTSPLFYYNGWEEGNILPDPALRITPISVVIGCQIPQAAGLAFAGRYNGEDNAAVCFIGDGGTSEGDFHEGLNFAAVWKAPVVYIVQNNQWAISIPRSAQTSSRTLAQKALAFDIPCLQVDGNDALAMWVAINEALDHARSGKGPYLIEAVTYRLMMHTTADDPKKYRDEAEEKCAWEKEPLIRFRAYLAARGIWDDERDAALTAELKEQVDQAVRTFETPTDWAQDTAFDHVYGTDHPHLHEQRAEFLANMRFDGGKEADHG